MIDAVYTAAEMALLIEAAEHFHRHARDYSGSYFEGVDTAALAETCGRLLAAWRVATLPAKTSWLGSIAAVAGMLRKRGRRPAIRVSRVDGGFHVVADDRLLDLTFAGLSELRHATRYELVPYSEDGYPQVRYRCVDRADVDENRLALIAAVIAKSWPDRAKAGEDDGEHAEPTDQERAETREALAELDRALDSDAVRRQVEQLKGRQSGPTRSLS